MEYLMERCTSPEAILTDDEGNKHYASEWLYPYMHHIQNRMFHGFHFDATMLRIASMNRYS